jgi:hypothetical protein
LSTKLISKIIEGEFEMDWNKFIRNTKFEKHVPLGAPPNVGGNVPITGNTFAGGAAGPAVTPAFAGGLQGAFGLQYTDVTLTSAQILALLTVPVNLVPAPGVGFWICPWFIIMRYIGGSVAYTDAGGAVSIGAGTLTTALTANTIFLTTVSPNSRKLVLFPFAAAVGAGVLDTAANPPTEDNAALAISKVTNNFAAGNGTMHISCAYTIETTL